MPPIDMNRALQSEAYARQCFINYNYKGNTMGITASEMGEVTSHWSSRVNSWKNYKENDSNDYNISEEDWNQGHEDAKNDLGYDYEKQNNKMVWKNVGLTTGALATHSVNAPMRQGHSPFKKGTEGGIVKGSDGKIDAKSSTGKGFVLAACAIDVANTAVYWATKPNDAAVEAVRDAAEVMPTLQEQAAANDSTMDCLDEELQDMTDIASETTEEANDGMADLETDYKMNADVIEYYKKAQVQGYQLTADDYETWKQSAQYMTENGEEIAAMNEEAAENVEEIRDDMDNYESEYDDVADNIDQSVTFCDEVDGFDQLTMYQCYIEAGAQTANAASAGVDGKKALAIASSSSIAFWASVPYTIAGVAALAAAAFDAVAVFREGKNALEVGEEIDQREETEDLNDANIEHYDENVDYYEGYKGDVDDLCLEVPDDVDEPEEPPTPGAPDGATGGGGTGGVQSGDTGNGKGRKVKKL